MEFINFLVEIAQGVISNAIWAVICLAAHTLR